MKTSPTLHRLLICLSILVLATGQAAVPPVPPPPPAPEPLTPAQTSYADWNFRSPVRFTHQSSIPASSEVQPEMTALPGCTEPSKELHSALVFSGFLTGANWNENIYYTNLCDGYAIPVTSEASSEFEPRLNPDAQSIIFTSDRDSTSKADIFNIFSSHINGSDFRQLTFNQGIDRMPSFSPDGKQIVFVSDRAGNAEIFRMNQDGSNPLQLTFSAEIDIDPDWSPDGKQIVWVRRVSGNLGVLSVMDANGANKRDLLPPLAYLRRPVWSPSGKLLAFHYDSNNDGWFELAIIRADGSGLTVLPIPVYDQYVDLEMGAWIPDESGLVYNHIVYLYNQGWRIDSAVIYRVYLNNLTSPYSITKQWVYAFSPHAKSRDDIPPVSTIAPLPEYSPAEGGIKLLWHVSDPKGQPFSYKLQVKSNIQPAWTTFESKVVGDEGPLPDPFGAISIYRGQPGTTVYFRIQFVDSSNNPEPEKNIPDAWTRIYDWKVQINVTDPRGFPLKAVEVKAAPAILNKAVTDQMGDTTVYFSQSGDHSINYIKAGYGALPNHTLNKATAQSVKLALPGSSEQLINGYFDDPEGPLSGWQSIGNLPIGSGSGHLHGQSAHIGSASGYLSGTSGAIGQTITLPETMMAPTLSFFYHIVSPHTNSESRFQVLFTPEDSQPVVLLDHAAKQVNWTHAWADLTPHLGKTGLLSFWLTQKEGENSAQVQLDEISVSSWPTPVLKQLSPYTVPYPEEDTWIDVYGENLWPEAQVFLGENPASAAERVSSTHIRVQIEKGHPPGVFPLRVVNTGGAEGQLMVYIGSIVFLPTVFR